MERIAARNTDRISSALIREARVLRQGWFLKGQEAQLESIPLRTRPRFPAAFHFSVYPFHPIFISLGISERSLRSPEGTKHLLLNAALFRDNSEKIRFVRPQDVSRSLVPFFPFIVFYYWSVRNVVRSFDGIGRIAIP